MQLQIPISLGELIDKMTILQIKLQKINDPHKVANIIKEYDLLKKVVSDNNISIDSQPLNEWMDQLIDINIKIWDAEDVIKQLESDNVIVNIDYRTNRGRYYNAYYAEISHISHSNNYQRYLIKQKINKHFNSDIQEEKGYL